MILEFSVLDTKAFSIEHLLDSPENRTTLKSFSVSDKAKGLETYLKEAASYDEKNNLSRTYLVKDKVTNEIAGYFSLRTGLITVRINNDKFDSLPAIELANFAVNQNYRKKHSNVEHLGIFIFKSFILPISNCIGKYIGISSLYLYALPNDRLIKHYQTMGFSRLPKEQEQFVQFHVKPKYDDGCIFMYQTL